MGAPSPVVVPDMRRRLAWASSFAVLAFPIGTVTATVFVGPEWEVTGWDTVWFALLISLAGCVAAAWARTAPIQMGLLAAEVVAFNSLLRGPGGVLAIPFLLGFGVLGGWVGGKLVMDPVALDDVPGGATLLARVAVGLGIVGVLVGFIPVHRISTETYTVTSHASESTRLSTRPDPCVAVSLNTLRTGATVAVKARHKTVAAGSHLGFDVDYRVKSGSPAPVDIYVAVRPADATAPVYAGWIGRASSMSGGTGTSGWNGLNCTPGGPAGSFSNTAGPGEYVAQAVIVVDGAAWLSDPAHFQVR